MNDTKIKLHMRIFSFVILVKNSFSNFYIYVKNVIFLDVLSKSFAKVLMVKAANKDFKIYCMSFQKKRNLTCEQNIQNTIVVEIRKNEF